MKIEELIEKLQTIARENPKCDVVKFDDSSCRYFRVKDARIDPEENEVIIE